jgi:hypothetical protein
VRAVLVCTTNDPDSGMTAGQEIEANFLGSPSYVIVPVTCTADATYLRIAQSSRSATSWQFPGQAGQVQLSSFNDFAIKVYYAQ